MRLDSSNPRLVGLWVATYPGLKAAPVACYGCGRVVLPQGKVYRLRLDKSIETYGREVVVGYLCRACRKALDPARKGHYFTRIG